MKKNSHKFSKITKIEKCHKILVKARKKITSKEIHQGRKS
jgi:hypothetical protein